MIKGLHCDTKRMTKEDLKIAAEMNCNTIVLYLVEAGLDRYDALDFKMIPMEVLLKLSDAISMCHDEGFSVAVKLHATPGEVELVGEARKYSWWQGFFQPPDSRLGHWFKNYFGNYVFPVAEVCDRKGVEVLYVGNEFYLLDRYEDEWRSWILNTRDFFGGKIGYCCFFTVPLHNYYMRLLKIAARIFGKERIFDEILKLAGPGRFKFKSYERKLKFIEGVARHEFRWQDALDIVGINIFYPVWWLRKEPTVEGYVDAYERTRFKIGFLSITVSYKKSVEWFVKGKPFVVTECFFRDDDPDWGEAGHKYDLYHAEFRTFWDLADGWLISFWKPNPSVPKEERDLIGGVFMPRYKVKLYKGTNVISVPLKPQKQPFRASDLLELTGGTLVAYLDAKQGKAYGFTPHMPQDSPANFVIDGKHGYYVQVSEDTEVEFVGTAWEG